MSKPIPKFASFRSKPASSQEEKSQKSVTQIKDEKDAAEPRRRHSSRSLERQHKRKSRGERGHEKDRSRLELQETAHDAVKAPPTESFLFDRDGEDLFRIDTRGDLANLTYGSLHKYNVPPFRRIGYGSVLGLNPRIKIDRNLSNEKGIVLQEPWRHQRLDRPLLLKPNVKDQRQMRLVRPTEEDPSLHHNEDFIGLQSNRKRKRGSESPIPENGEPNYRSIEGKAKPSQEPADIDLEYFSDSSGPAMAEEAEAARKRNGELTRITRENPGNLSAWLKLIEHQAELFGSSDSSGNGLSSIEQRNLADIRVTIYEHGLQSIGNYPEAKVTLWIGLLNEGKRIWEARKLSTKWQEALQAHPSAIQLWTSYLNFIQTSSTEFRYERCKSEYIKCLQILAEAIGRRENHGKLHQDQFSKIFIYLFLRITIFMRQAGYHEHAEALWQAAHEIRFAAPESLQSENAADADLFSSLESFWESEVPRIGEPEAKGWSQFSAEDAEPSDGVVVQLEVIDKTRNLFKSFTSAEGTMARRLLHPGRSADEAGEDDPYHIIFFNDIKPFLIPHLLRSTSKTDFVHALLLYHGLPPLPWARDRTYEAWWLDTFLCSTRAYASSDSPPVKHIHICSETLFSDSFAGIDLEDAAWVRRALHMLCGHSGDEEMAEYMIAFDFHYFPDLAAKTAKSVIKVNRTSLRLYSCYGLIESRASRQDSAKRVFAAAIDMSTSLNDEQKKYAVCLWRTWIWEALRLGNFNDAVQRISCVGEPIPTSQNTSLELIPPVLLRITKWLSNGRDSMISIGHHHLAVLHCELLALVAYFRHGKSIEDALAVYSENFSLFKARELTSSPAFEHLHQCQSQLSALHLSHATLFRPSLIRDALADSIRSSPNNTIFLTAYIKNEARFRIEDRVRSLISSTVLHNKQETIVGHFIAIWAEQQRGLEFGSTIHAIRAVYEQAVASNIGKHSIALWESYFHFEKQNNEKKKARDVFLRGLRCLPWSKWFLVMGLGDLDDITFEEGRSLWNVFGERELRVHVDIDEHLEEIGERRG